MNTSFDSLPLEFKRAIDAAEGWMELGDLEAAMNELEGLPDKWKTNFHVLELRCEIWGKAGMWNYVLPVAETLHRLAPDHVQSWVQKSNALHGLERFDEAVPVLKQAIELFPHDPYFVYRLAVLEASRGNLTAANEALQECAARDVVGTYKLQALEDPILSDLWQS